MFDFILKSSIILTVDCKLDKKENRDIFFLGEICEAQETFILYRSFYLSYLKHYFKELLKTFLNNLTNLKNCHLRS